jgi:hypothetical protein
MEIANIKRLNVVYTSVYFCGTISDFHFDALKLKIGRMMVSMLTVSPMLAMISSAGL